MANDIKDRCPRLEDINLRTLLVEDAGFRDPICNAFDACECLINEIASEGEGDAESVKTEQLELAVEAIAECVAKVSIDKGITLEEAVTEVLSDVSDLVRGGLELYLSSLYARKREKEMLTQLCDLFGMLCQGDGDADKD